MLLRFAQSAAAIELSIILGPVISALDASSHSREYDMKYINKIFNLFAVFICIVIMLIVGVIIFVSYIQISSEPKIKLSVSNDGQSFVFNIDPSTSMYLSRISVQKIDTQEYLWDVDLSKKYKIIKYGEVIFDRNDEIVAPHVLPGKLSSQMAVKVSIGYHYQDITGAVSSQKIFIEKLP